MTRLAAIVALGLAMSGRSADQTVLAVDGPFFTVNGKQTLLLGISYYGALGASEETIRADLASMKQRGINWIRVWATWAAFGNDVSVVDASGNTRNTQMDRLAWIVKECDRRRMLVDVTLSRGNGITGSPRLQGPALHRRAVESIVGKFSPFRNWYLDLSNERNIKDKRFTSFEELRELLARAKAMNPGILVTASHAGDISRDDLRRYLSHVKVDFITPHRPRNSQSAGETEVKTREYLAGMKEIGRTVPVHYQEPFRRGFGEYEPAAPDFLGDLKAAIAGGAAGWCFHNGDGRGREDGLPRRSFDLRGGPLFDVLDPVEQEVVTAMADTARGAAKRSR